MQFTAAQIATLIQGRVAGDPNAGVRNVARIEEAGPGDLSFIADPRYLEHLHGCKASVIIISESLFDANESVAPTQIVVPNARGAFAVLLEQYNNIMSGQSRKGIEQPSFVHESAQLGEDVYVGAFAYIGAGAVLAKGAKVYPNSYIGTGVEVGEGTVVYPGVCICDGCRIGARVVVHSGTVIGADGFGFAPQADGSYKKIPQIGNVVIEDDVEIGSNTTIDRATMGSTVIRRGVKLDNLIQIAHNVEVGEHTAIAAQTGIAGSTKVGRHCIVGGQVGVVGHIAIADRVSINAQSGIGGNITEEGAKLTGSPAADYRSSLKSQVIFRNLPSIETRLREAEKKLEALTKLLTKHEVAGEDTGHGG